jgi:hypothetical protein
MATASVHPDLLLCVLPSLIGPATVTEPQHNVPESYGLARNSESVQTATNHLEAARLSHARSAAGAFRSRVDRNRSLMRRNFDSNSS